MNAKTTLRTSKNFDDAPVWAAEDFKTAAHRVGMKPAPLQKQKINIALDPEIVSWFKQQAGGRGYQTLINATLREAMQHQTLEETLRKVIREELHTV
jgi:uncharacterized protein (DUF4415 family)